MQIHHLYAYMHSTYSGEKERAYARQVTYTHAMKCN